MLEGKGYGILAISFNPSVAESVPLMYTYFIQLILNTKCKKNPLGRDPEPSTSIFHGVSLSLRHIAPRLVFLFLACHTFSFWQLSEFALREGLENSLSLVVEELGQEIGDPFGARQECILWARILTVRSKHRRALLPPPHLGIKTKYMGNLTLSLVKVKLKLM